MPILARHSQRPSTEHPTRRPPRPHRLARAATSLGLALLGLIGLTNSWAALYAAASSHMTGTWLPTVTIGRVEVNTSGASLPLLLDLLIIIASSRYVIGVKEGRPVGGWRVAAHSAITLTVLFNASTARRPADIAWHVIAPAVLSAVIELVAREILGTLREVADVRTDRIPLRLWLSAPAESVRAAWRMARTGQPSAATARSETEQCAAARDRLRGAIPGRSNWRARRQILRRLWSGALAPSDLIGLIGDHAGDPRVILTSVLDAVGAKARPDEARPRARGTTGGPAPEARGNEAQAPEARGEARPEARPPGMEAEARRQASEAEAAWHEARPGGEAPRQAGPEAGPEARGEAEAGGTRRGPSITDVLEALARSEITEVSRTSLKTRFRIGSSRADKIVQDWKDHQQQTQTTP